VILVDAQNRYSLENTWDEDEVEELGELIDKVASMNPVVLSTKSRVVHVPRHRFGELQLEIGDNGLTLWLMEINGTRVMLAVFDGNNVVGELVDKIINRFRDIFHIVEVLSTDNHQFTGLASLPLGRGYHVVGEGISHDSILRIMEEEVSRHMNNLMESHPQYLGITVDDVRMLGSEGFMKLEEAARLGVRDWWKFFLMLLVVPVALTLALGAL
jgi:putative membrane protein